MKTPPALASESIERLNRQKKGQIYCTTFLFKTLVTGAMFGYAAAKARNMPEPCNVDALLATCEVVITSKLKSMHFQDSIISGDGFERRVF